MTTCTCTCTCGAEAVEQLGGLEDTLTRAVALNGPGITESVAQALGTNTTIEGQNR